MSTIEVDLRDRIVSAGIFAYRAADFHAVDATAIAEHAGVTRQEFCRAFPVWELFIIAVIDRWSSAQQAALRQIAEQEGAVAHLRARLETGLEDPALVRLRLALQSAASNPAHAAAGFFRRQYAEAFEDLTLALVRDVVVGREPRGVSPRLAAEQLLALYEGLQLQSLLRDDGDTLPGFDRAVARMRVGWRSALATRRTALR